MALSQWIQAGVGKDPFDWAAVQTVMGADPTPVSKAIREAWFPTPPAATTVLPRAFAIHLWQGLDRLKVQVHQQKAMQVEIQKRGREGFQTFLASGKKLRQSEGDEL